MMTTPVLVRFALIAFVSASGCAFALQAPTPREKELAKARWDREQREWTPELDGQGNYVHPAYRDSMAYCKDIQVEGDSAFKELVGWGWIVSAAGAAGVGGLTAAAAKSSGTRNTGLLAGGAGLGAVVTALGIYMIEMGSTGRRTAAAAGAALSEAEDAERWKQCTAALKTWGSSNADTAQEAAKTIADAIKSKSGGTDDPKAKSKDDAKKADTKKGATPSE